MRTLIDLDEKLVRDLDAIAADAKRSRASLVREAVADFLAKARPRRGRGKEAFGLWSKRKIDGLEYQRKLRAEW